jgi:required for meiotic nuclear division protein 1
MNTVVPLSSAVETLHVRALLIGRHLDLRGLTGAEAIGRNPLTVAVRGGGKAVLLRYGAAVMFGVDPDEESAFLADLAPYLREPLAQPEVEDLTILIDPARADVLERERLILTDADVPRFQVVADVLGKSVLLADQEAQVGLAFDRIEPLAEELKEFGRGARRTGALVRHIGETLLIQHRLVGRAEVGDKPDIIWERSDLERLFLALEGEYEIRERQLALERKLTLINETAGTLLELLQSKRSLRVEWYIVILIVVEIVLTLYELFMRGQVV